jgi:S-DNA-T family DNA segregation ATPase FtsK/SpoIIIE
MTSRVRFEIEVSRSDSEPWPVAVSAPAESSAASVLDALGAHVGLSNSSGAVQARSLISGAWVDRRVRIGDLGLLRGERLSLVVGLKAGGKAAPLTRWTEAKPGDHDGRVAVNRPPRSVRNEPELSIALPRRQTTRAPRRFPLGSMLIPLLIGGILVLVTRRWEIALFALFTPVMVAWNFFEERRARSDETKQYGHSFAEEGAAALDRVQSATAEWAAWLHEHYPGPAELSAIVHALTPRLWERQPGDPDFLRLRLGLASRRAPVTLRQEEQLLAVVDEDVPDYEGAATAADVPAVADLLGAGGLAVVGADPEVDRCIGWLVSQVVALHSPSDVMVAGAFADRDTADWVRWLPHVGHGWLSAPAIGSTDEESTALLQAVVDLGRARREARDDRRARADETGSLVVFLDGRLQTSAALVAEAAAMGDLGILLVWFGTEPRAVPTAVRQQLSFLDGRGELVDHRGGERLALVPDSIGRSDGLDLSSQLAPLRDAADARQLKSIPERVLLDDVLPDAASPVSMRRRWEQAPVTALTAHLGIGADGPVDLELGPSGSHALIGGTTGSGKSELLQAMVASVAAAYAPDRVGFLLVDYKGGAAFKDAMHLPHCVGVVTDLDEHLTQRVMVALRAEIKRREELLGSAGVRDLTEFRRVAPADAPGDLVIVVDEFATLAKELPAFVEGVVDIAALGRSLGLRLVLATQRPAGVINDRIRANVGVRIALRVNDEVDSMDVIDSREAAHIPRRLPGRAFVKVDRSLTEFQTAFAGASARSGADAAIDVRALWSDWLDRPEAVTSRTVLEDVVSAADKVMRLGKWQLPHVPWLPAIPPVVLLGDLAAKVPDLTPGAVVMGLADLPERQSQQVVGFDLDRHPSMLVFGTSRSGKTTFLRSVAAGFIASTAPEDLVIYGLDFAGQGLHTLEGAPQVGAVVGADDLGRLARVLRALTRIVDERKRTIAANGLTGYAGLRAHSTAPIPRVLVLLDGYSGAASALERVDGGRLLERLGRLAADGASVGVHFVITADRRASVPSSLTSVITSRLVLRMAEKDDYTLVGVTAGLVHHASMPPGRGYLQGSTEIQVGVLDSSDPSKESAALAAVIAQARKTWPTQTPQVGRMPTQLATAHLPKAPSSFVLPLGVGDAEGRVLALDLSDGHALVTGPPRGGKSTTLATLAFAASRAPNSPALGLITARRTPIAGAVKWEVGPVDATDATALAAVVDGVGELLAAGREVLLFIDDADSLPEAASLVLEELSRRGRDEPVRLVVAADNRWAGRAYSGLVPEIRRAKQGVLMSPDVDIDGDLVGVRLRTPLESSSLPGRGFLARSGAYELVQVASGPRT